MNELISALATLIIIAVSRWLSSKEHKKTEKQVTEIHFLINGEVQKKIEQAREEGRQEILNQNK